MAGSTCDGRSVYVARVWHKGLYSPYGINPRLGSFIETGDNSSYISYMCYMKEQKATQCEVLTGSGFSWVAASYGSVPEGAWQWETDDNGIHIYVTRNEIKGEQCIGSLIPYDGSSKFLYNGDSRGDLFYEVLVERT